MEGGKGRDCVGQSQGNASTQCRRDRRQDGVRPVEAGRHGVRPVEAGRHGVRPVEAGQDGVRQSRECEGTCPQFTYYFVNSTA